MKTGDIYEFIGDYKDLHYKVMLLRSYGKCSGHKYCEHVCSCNSWICIVIDTNCDDKEFWVAEAKYYSIFRIGEFCIESDMFKEVKDEKGSIQKMGEDAGKEES